MPSLVLPTSDLHEAWLEAHREWGPGSHEDGFGLFPSDDVVSSAGFAAWLRRLDDEADGPATDTGSYRCLYRWILDDDAVVGGIALRHGDHPFIEFAGHIGYGIRPSARRRGLATWAVGSMLDVAREVGLERVLLVCESTNAASRATIERNGGVLERLEDEDGPVSRYRISLPRRTGRR